eukprot:scaffold90187_cov31-Attheya_sp.AAC.2
METLQECLNVLSKCRDRNAAFTTALERLQVEKEREQSNYSYCPVTTKVLQTRFGKSEIQAQAMFAQGGHSAETEGGDEVLPEWVHIFNEYFQWRGSEQIW